MAKKENATKNFVLRIDAEMMDAIETWAADEFRSINGPDTVHSGSGTTKGRPVKKEKTIQEGRGIKRIRIKKSIQEGD